MKIGERITNPGELRTPILLAPPAVTTEAGGFMRPAPDVANQVSVWARWTNAHGQETWLAQSVQAEAPATVLIRYRAGVDATWYISKDNGASWYELVGPPDDIQERHEYMELRARKMRAG